MSNILRTGATGAISDYFFTADTDHVATWNSMSKSTGLIYTDEDGNQIDILRAIKGLDENYNKIMERLSILDDPSPEKLEKHKMLREAYAKYKFIEALCNESDDT